MRLVYFALKVPEHAQAARRLSWQLATALTSLRRFNRQIPVSVHVFGEASGELLDAARAAKVDLRLRGCHARYLEATGHRAHAALARLPWLDKWLLMGELAPDAAEQVLYCDCDTVFARDVARLFERFTELDLYAREEPFTRRSPVHDPRHVDQPALERIALADNRRLLDPFNTGVMLMNHGAWSRIGAHRALFLDYVWRFLCGFAAQPVAADLEAARFLRGDGAPLISDADRAARLPFPAHSRWLMEEVSAWLTLGAIEGLRTGLLRRRHVLQDGEYTEPQLAAGPWTVCHYFGAELARFRAWYAERVDSEA